MNTIPAGSSLPMPHTPWPNQASAPANAELPPALTATPLARPVVNHRGRSVLVIDDEAGMRVMARAILESVEYSTEVAESGEEALQLYRARWEAGNPIDVIVMDLALPGGISGVETLGYLREINEEVRVIACSGYLEANSREAALRTGFAGVLPKPYTADRLAAVVRHAMEN